MEVDGFEGISLNKLPYSNDLLLAIVYFLLFVFAVIFRQNVSLLRKMLSDVIDKEQKNSIFDTTDKGSFLFNAFMGFQTLILLSIYVFSLAVKHGYIESPDIKTTLLYMVGLIFIFFIFDLFKRSMLNILLYVFAEDNQYKMLQIIHKSLFQLWGVFLYVPVFWILLIGNYIFFMTIILIISYILIGIISAYRFINIFSGKNVWLLFLNSYLCAQEIVPLVFLYEGLIYIYNIIEQ
jgi:flagellar biosynthesis protein FlhB